MKFLQALVVVCLCAGPLSADNFLVLPFFNNSRSSTLDWVGESISETIREALASEGVLTLDRDAREEGFRRLSMKPYFPLTKASVIRLAERLDADQVIFGSFELVAPEEQSKSKGTLRIHAEAVNIKNVRRGPEYKEEGQLEDLTRLQSHLAWQTMSFVLGERRPSEEDFSKRQPVVRVDAIESYVRGLLAGAPDQKLKYFTQAVRLEPQYSNANYQLGRLHLSRKNYKQAAEALQKVQPSYTHHREATFLLGLARYNLNEFAAAEQAFQTVANEVPLNEVLNNLGAAQSRLKRSSAALENFQKALDGDATDPAYQFNVGYALLQQANLEAAADRFRAVLDRTPDDAEAMTLLGRCVNPGAAKTPARAEGVERLKENYEESAYWQLKAVLEPKQ